MPVMVCMDGFILTHAYERVDIPEQAESTPSCRRTSRARCSIPPIRSRSARWSGPEAFMEVRYLAHAKQISALEHIPRIAAEFEQRFGRRSGGPRCAATAARTPRRSSSPSAR
jgi:pyruvate ferredoxin oxidoreductase alpha subunit